MHEISFSVMINTFSSRALSKMPLELTDILPRIGNPCKFESSFQPTKKVFIIVTEFNSFQMSIFPFNIGVRYNMLPSFLNIFIQAL